MNTDLRREMQQLLDDWAAAIVANDPARIAGFAEDRWALVGGRGALPRQRFLDVVASGELTHEAMSFDVLDVWDRGEVVVVLAHGTNSGHWQGSPFTADEFVTEVFSRDGEGWRCVVSALSPRMA